MLVGAGKQSIEESSTVAASDSQHHTSNAPASNSANRNVKFVFKFGGAVTSTVNLSEEQLTTTATLLDHSITLATAAMAEQQGALSLNLIGQEPLI